MVWDGLIRYLSRIHLSMLERFHSVLKVLHIIFLALRGVERRRPFFHEVSGVVVMGPFEPIEVGMIEGDITPMDIHDVESSDGVERIPPSPAPPVTRSPIIRSPIVGIRINDGIRGPVKTGEPPRSY